MLPRAQASGAMSFRTLPIALMSGAARAASSKTKIWIRHRTRVRGKGPKPPSAVTRMTQTRRIVDWRRGSIRLQPWRIISTTSSWSIKSRKFPIFRLSISSLVRTSLTSNREPSKRCLRTQRSHCLRWGSDSRLNKVMSLIYRTLKWVKCSQYQLRGTSSL